MGMSSTLMNGYRFDGHSTWGYTSASIPECQFHNSVKRVARVGVCQTGVCQGNVVPVARWTKRRRCEGEECFGEVVCRSPATMSFAFQNQQNKYQSKRLITQKHVAFSKAKLPMLSLTTPAWQFSAIFAGTLGRCMGTSYKTIMMAQTRQQG